MTPTPPPRINRGDVFWIGPDADGGPNPNHPHPHVVIQDDLFNHHSRISTVIVVALSTNLRRAGEPGNILLDPGEANLPKPSIIIPAQIASVPKSRLGERIGALSPTRVDQILDGLRFLQATYFRR